MPAAFGGGGGNWTRRPDFAAVVGGITHGQQINASNTGIAGIGVLRSSLTPQGATTYATDGQTITGMLFTDTVTVTGSNVTLKGCQFETTGSAAKAIIVNGVNTWIESCTILAPTGSMYMCVNVSNGTGTTLKRVDASLSENIVTIENDGCHITECFLHDVSNVSNPTGHRDVIEIYGGSNHLVEMSRLTMDAGETSVVNLAPWWSNTSVINAYIQDCYMDGGNMHFVVDLQSTGVLQGIRVLRNKMGGHTNPGVIGRYAALNNAKNKAITQTVAAQAAAPDSILWPSSGADVNYWVDCADLTPNNSGLVVTV